MKISNFKFQIYLLYIGFGLSAGLSLAQSNAFPYYELQIPSYEGEIAAKHNGFVENVGQLGVYGSTSGQATAVSYYSNQNEYSDFIQRDRLSFVHGKRIVMDSSLHEVNKLDLLFFENNSKNKSPRFLSPEPHLERYAKHNFYTNLTGSGAENVKEYGELHFRNLYDGIDMSLTHNRIGLRAYFEINPGYDPLSIRIGFEGLSGLNFSGSTMTVSNYTTNYQFLDPIAYQIDALDNITYVTVSYAIDMNGRVFFALGSYDLGEKLFVSVKQGNNPVPTKDVGDNMEWSSYIGQLGINSLADVATDASGNSIYFGSVEYAQFMTSSAILGSQIMPHMGGVDAFLIKFNTIMEPQFYTYFGGSAVSTIPGSGTDNAKSITTSLDKIYITGSTSSTNLPIMNTGGFTGGSSNLTTCSGCYDLFYAQLSSNGNMQYNTYYGGSQNEVGNSILYKNSNNSIYILGEGSGANTPYLAPLDPAKYNSTSGNGLILRFDQSNQLVWSTGFEVDQILASTKNEAEHLIIGGTVVGQTLPSINQPTNTDFNTYNGGLTDGFVAMFDAQDNLMTTSYYGTDCDDYISDLAGHGGSTRFYGVGGLVNGLSCGNDLPVIGNGLSRPTGNSAEHFYFSAYLSASGVDYLHSGYFGGGDKEDIAYGIIDGEQHPGICLLNSGFAITGSSYVANQTTQKIPLLPCNPIGWYEELSCYSGFPSGWGADAYLAIFNSSCELKYSTYFGKGLYVDGGNSLAYSDANGINRVYFGGNAGTQNNFNSVTNSADFLYTEEYDITPGTSDYYKEFGNPGTNFNMWGAFFNLDGINDVPCNLTIDEKTQGDDVLIFPNPATNKVNIVSNSEIESFEIIDLFGRVCYSESNPKMHYAFSLDGFSSGEYIIIGYTNLGTFHHKLIVR